MKPRTSLIAGLAGILAAGLHSSAGASQPKISLPPPTARELGFGYLAAHSITTVPRDRRNQRQKRKDWRNAPHCRPARNCR